MNAKEKLIEKITSIEDPQILEEIDRWVTSILGIISVDQYSKKELNALREGYQQYQYGDAFTEEEANQIFDQWLKDK